MILKQLFKLLVFVLWAVVIYSFFSVLSQQKTSDKIIFKGFGIKPINQQFEFTNMQSNNDQKWFQSKGAIRNISTDDLEVKKISFSLINRYGELIQTEDYYFPESNKIIKKGETWPFELDLTRPDCMSDIYRDKLKCNLTEDFRKIEVSAYSIDIYWNKEVVPNQKRPLRPAVETLLVSDMKIQPMDQSYDLNDTAKLTYLINGKTRTIYGNFGGMVNNKISPEYKDVNNDGIKEVILINETHSETGMNYVIMKLKGEALVPMEVVTEFYDSLGNKIDTVYSDSGLKNLEIADFNSDGCNDLKTHSTSFDYSKTYYWNEEKEIHLRKVVQGAN